MQLSPWTMSRLPWMLTKQVYNPWKSSPSTIYSRKANIMLRLKVVSLTHKVVMAECWLGWSRICRFAISSAKALSPTSAFPRKATEARPPPRSCSRRLIKMWRSLWLRSTVMYWVVESPKLASKRSRPTPGGPIRSKWTSLHQIKRKLGG